MSSKQNTHVSDDRERDRGFDLDHAQLSPSPDAGFIQAWLENVVVSALVDAEVDPGHRDGHAPDDDAAN